LGGKPEEKRPLEIPRGVWEGNIKIDRREIEWEGEWTGFIWLRIGISGELLLTR
jgi:hypothetical protein